MGVIPLKDKHSCACYYYNKNFQKFCMYVELDWNTGIVHVNLLLAYLDQNGGLSDRVKNSFISP